MIDRITPRLIELVYNAALHSFWRKQALRKFLRESKISERFLSTWSAEESKREFLDRLFGVLQKKEGSKAIILLMANALYEQRSFPDLENWEDSEEKIRRATKAINELRKYLRDQEEDIKTRQAKEEAQKKFKEHLTEVRRSKTDLKTLNDRLTELSKRAGTQQAGYDFQDWFFDLLDFSEIINRRPYIHDGRQIDGSLTLLGTTYLIELKFTNEQVGATDIDSLYKKVSDKADNTMGIMVSMAGFSSVAIREASGPKTPLLLFDFRHLFYVLSGILPLSEVIDRVRRHASQTGEAYLSPNDFSG